ncbi:hypothetical protein [Nonlabens ulvanivorans]|uniref:hypothetical protein n=1 Tax=Nonlabens ulvanivorans TaxID=906888 RepID=UPI002943D68B|nr:hypothetical protein [Nonlabens ulvanivorans]WOI23335.1 hypothetical protein R1T42_02560 [Nonlabens ulvanivorans]
MIKRSDILKETHLMLCSILTGRLQSIFLFALILFIIPFVLFITAPIIDYKIIIGSILCILFGLWLVRSRLRDYKEEYRRQDLKKKQRKKGLRN